MREGARAREREGTAIIALLHFLASLLSTLSPPPPPPPPSFLSKDEAQIDELLLCSVIQHMVSAQTKRLMTYGALAEREDFKRGAAAGKRKKKNSPRICRPRPAPFFSLSSCLLALPPGPLSPSLSLLQRQISPSM